MSFTASIQQSCDADRVDDLSAAADVSQLAPFSFPEFNADDATDLQSAAETAADLNVRIELGRTEFDEKQLTRLQPGSVIRLKQTADDPVDVFVEERLIGRGEVLVLNDRFCVRLIELLANDD